MVDVPGLVGSDPTLTDWLVWYFPLSPRSIRRQLQTCSEESVCELECKETGRVFPLLIASTVSASVLRTFKSSPIWTSARGVSDIRIMELGT